MPAPKPVLTEELRARLFETTREVNDLTARLVAAGELEAERLSEEGATNFLRFLAEQSDAQAIVSLLTLHKTAERHAEVLVMSPLLAILEAEAAALFWILRQLNEEVFDDALAIWWEEVSESESGGESLTVPLEFFDPRASDG
jgi:hypothetical protein